MLRSPDFNKRSTFQHEQEKKKKKHLKTYAVLHYFLGTGNFSNPLNKYITVKLCTHHATTCIFLIHIIFLDLPFSVDSA